MEARKDSGQDAKDAFPKLPEPTIFQPMADPSSASSTPGRTTCRASPSTSPTARSSWSPGPPARARARSPSTPSTPRGSAATSSRSRPTPSSSSIGCPSRWWTGSRASRPAVAIEQRNPVVSSRSTVGTATEVYDYLRLLWARVGQSYCRVCGGAGAPRHAAVRGRRRAGLRRRGRLQVALPAPAGRPADPRGRGGESARARLRPRGRRRRRRYHLDELPAAASTSPRAERAARGGGPAAAASRQRPGRLAEALATAFQEGEGVALVLHDGGTAAGSPSSPPAAAATPPPPRSPPRSSPSTTRAAPAPPATDSARCWSTTSR